MPPSTRREGTSPGLPNHSAPQQIHLTSCCGEHNLYTNCKLLNKLCSKGTPLAVVYTARETKRLVPPSHANMQVRSCGESGTLFYIPWALYVGATIVGNSQHFLVLSLQRCKALDLQCCNNKKFVFCNKRVFTMQTRCSEHTVGPCQIDKSRCWARCA